MNRKAKKAMAMGMAALVAVTSVGGNTAEAAVKKLTKKATVTKSLTVKVGKTKKISVKKVPKKTKVTYKTNKKKIATVTKKGVVKGVKKGKAVITVKLKYKKKTITKKCNVTVKKATTTKVTATATPTVPAQVPTATPVAPTATPGTNATATPGADVTATPGADATETPGSDAPTTTTTPGAETPTGTETPGKDETEKPDDVTSGGAVTPGATTPGDEKDETEKPDDVTSGGAVTPGATTPGDEKDETEKPDDVTKILNVTSGAVKNNKVTINDKYDVVNVSANVGTAVIDVNGTIGTLNLESGAGYTVNLNDVTVDNIAVAKDGDFVKADATKTKVPTVNMTNKAEVKDVKVSADVTLKGEPKKPVKTITVDKKASVKIGVPTETVTVSAKEAEVSISSNVDAVEVRGSNVKITVAADAIVAKMEITGDDTTITGEGKIEVVEVNGNNTVIEDVQTDKVTVADKAEGTKINNEEVAAGTKRTSSTMTFTTANDYAYMMVTSGGSVSAYAVSSTAVKDFYDGKETVVIYDEISLEDGNRVRKEAEVTGYEEKGKVVSLGGITCTVSGNKNGATVVVSSDVAEVQFIGYKQYTKADQDATLIDGDNKYVITYSELKAVYNAKADTELSVKYKKNEKEVTEKVTAGKNEVTIDGITCKVLVDEEAKTADVFVLKSGVVLK